MNMRILLVTCVLGLNTIASVSAMQKPAPKKPVARPKAKQAQPKHVDDKRMNACVDRIISLPQDRRDAVLTLLEQLLKHVEAIPENDDF